MFKSQSKELQEGGTSVEKKCKCGATFPSNMNRVVQNNPAPDLYVTLIVRLCVLGEASSFPDREAAEGLVH